MNKKQMIENLDEFTHSYLVTALSSYGEVYSVQDFSEETLKQAIADCSAFQDKHWDLIRSNLRVAGHDFWLTRCGHGVGFWDCPEGKTLTAASKTYGTIDLYLGNDGQIYSQILQRTKS